MRGLVLLVTALLLFVSCDEEDKVTHTTLMFNIYKDGSIISDGTVIAAVFEDEGKEIDYEASVWNDDGKFSLPYKDGSNVLPKYSRTNSVNTLEYIPVGDYILVAYYQPFVSYYYSIKAVELTKEIETYSMDFTAEDYGYESWEN